MYPTRNLLLALAGLLFAQAIQAQITYLHCGRLLPINSEPVSAVTLVVENNKLPALKKVISPPRRAPDSSTSKT